MRKLLVLSLAFITIFYSCTQSERKYGMNLDFGWKFKIGDSLAYASPTFDDSAWDTIMMGHKWEGQGYEHYDGYAWYRTSFDLPTSLKNNSAFQDSLLIRLGAIDDCDQVFLNGKLIGQNGKVIPVSESETPGKFEGDPTSYSLQRDYVLDINDPRILWDQRNIIAIRVSDHAGGGGVYTRPQYIGVKDIKDYMILDNKSIGLLFSEKGYKKKYTLTNTAGFTDMIGRLAITVKEKESGKTIFTKNEDINIAANQSVDMEFEFIWDAQDVIGMIEYVFTDDKTGYSISEVEMIPYILTPRPAETPRINGSKVFGARPGSPIAFKVPATGMKPIQFSAENLPEGLVLDQATGIISGKLVKEGEYVVKLKATNEKGSYERDMKFVIGNKLSLTPPLGWNSWNCWGLSIDEVKVKAAADAMVNSGLADHGWAYVNIDDGWESAQRNAKGEIETNEKFKDMKALADYVHSLGLKIGIYSSPGPLTCGKYLGSYQHEEKDAKTYADWGIDYLKHDWCSYSQIATIKDLGKDDIWSYKPESKIPDANLAELQKPYIIMRDALQKQNRDIIYSLCQYGMGYVWEWGDKVGGQLWRTTGDIVDTWESMSGIGFKQSVCAPANKPGNWNDPDMLVVGMVGWGPSLHPTRLTASEQYTHISLWALLSSPLLIGCDMTKLDAFTLNLLTNDEVLEINQDILGISAVPVVQTTNYQIWMKTLEDGSKAVGFFNLSLDEITVKATWQELGIEGKQTVRDVWRQKDLGDFESGFDTKLLPHGVTLVKISKK